MRCCWSRGFLGRVGGKGRLVGDGETDVSPGLVAGGEFLCSLLRQGHGVGAEQQAQASIVSAGDVSDPLGDASCPTPSTGYFTCHTQSGSCHRTRTAYLLAENGAGGC